MLIIILSCKALKVRGMFISAAASTYHDMITATTTASLSSFEVISTFSYILLIPTIS
jgi:hypothetical protein